MQFIVVIMSLVFVLGIMYGFFKIMYGFFKLLQKSPIYSKLSNHNRIKVEAITYIDNSTKVVMVRAGSIVYVLAVTKSKATLIDKYSEAELI